MQWVWNKELTTHCVVVSQHFLRWTNTYDSERISEIPSSGSAYFKLNHAKKIILFLS